MPLVNTTKSKVSEYLFYGTQYNGNSPVTNIPVSRTPTSSIIDSSFYHEWVRTPNYWKKVPVTVRWIPKGNKPLRTRPTEPWPFKPRPLPVAKPRDKTRSLASYQRYLNRLGIKLKKTLAANYKNQVKYLARYAKYLRKLQLFEKQQSLIRNGVVKTRKVPRVMGREHLQWNARERRMRIYRPLTGSYTTNNRNKRTDGDWIDTYSTISGNIEDFFPTALQVGVNAAGAPTAFATAVSAATSHATAKLYDKLGDQSAHIANIIAERHQTYSLIANNVKRLMSMVDTFRKVKRRGNVDIDKKFIKRSGKQISNEVLQFFFGVQPLIDDIEALAEKAAHWNEYGPAKTGDSITVKASGKGFDNARTTVVSLSNGKPYMETTTDVRVTVQVRYVLEYSMQNPALAELQKLGLINPLEVAWEMTPWSFVVDWLLPVGNWISAFTADAGLTYKRGVKTTITEYHTTVTRNFVGKQGDNLTANSDSWKTGSAVATDWYRVEKRETLSSPPSVRFPSFKSPWSYKHLAESIALFVQRVK